MRTELEYRVNTCIPVMPYGTLNWWQLLHSHLRGGLCDINFLWTAHVSIMRHHLPNESINSHQNKADSKFNLSDNKVQYIDPAPNWKLPSLLVWMSHNTNCLIIHACALHVHKLNMQGADFWRVTEQEAKLSTRTQCV